jgi:hypothetical protein
MKRLVKKQHAAGGFILLISEQKKCNLCFGEAKQRAIIKAIEDSWTEGVYMFKNRRIKRQLLNGTCEFLNRNNEFI